MTIKSILVHLDPSPSGAERMQMAAVLAGAFEAHLTGLYVIPPSPAFVDPAAIAAAGGLPRMHYESRGENVFRAARDETKRAFDSCVETAAIESTWRDVEGPVSAVVSVCARLADLVVVGQTPPTSGDAAVVPNVAAEVALECGRPTLVVPYAGHRNGFGRRVMLAWNGSRECARAARDALPFLHRASEIVALTVLDKEEIRKSSVCLLGIHVGDYLARHGIDAEWRRETTNVSVGDEILSRMREHSCDLLVMGAYGHSRFREFVFGGVTRHLLEHMSTPVLMSH